MNKILSALIGFALCGSAHAQTSRQINQGDVSAFTVTSVGAGCGTSTGGSAITTTGNVTAAMPIRSVTGTTDTILSTDCGGRIVYNSASAVAVTLPVATTSGFGSGTFFDVVNEGAGTVTITPTTSTINLGATLVLTTGQGAGVGSDGTNYSVNLGKGGTTFSVGGTAAMGTGAIVSAACATAVSITASGVATTDTVTASFNGDPSAVTGYVPLTTGMLTILVYPTSGNVNFKVCNNTAASITPGAITLNWRVVR